MRAPTVEGAARGVIVLAFAMLTCGLASHRSAAPAFAIQAQDTAGVLRAVATQMRIERASEDSARAVRCRDGDRATCPPLYRHPPLWYLPADSSRDFANARALARTDSTAVRDAATLPSCPWPASAPLGSGFQARVSVEFESDAAATVVVSLRCDNPPGYMHDEHVHERTYSVIRSRSAPVWTATLERARIT